MMDVIATLFIPQASFELRARPRLGIGLSGIADRELDQLKFSVV